MITLNSSRFSRRRQIIRLTSFFCLLCIMFSFTYLFGNEVKIFFLSNNDISIESSKRCARANSFRTTCERMDILIEESVDQYDFCLCEYIATNYLLPPPGRPYNITFPSRGSDKRENIIDIIQELMPNKQGFFIECGANDGEFSSNTLTLEADYNWTGLLIEADRDTFKRLESKNRNAWVANLCLSPKNYTQKLKYYVNSKFSAVNALWNRTDFGKTEEINIQCVPLFSILLAMNIFHVDYFSLDIEGLELEVLKTIPFDLVSFTVLTVEHWFVHGGLKAVSDFLYTKGYILVTQIIDDHTRDGLYVHKSLQSRISKTTENY